MMGPMESAGGGRGWLLIPLLISVGKLRPLAVLRTIC